uniref:DNA mismatch repair protein n=1 Tax=Oryza punctata TaxID=4537 RepID=A0A0E0M117_ORYPU
MASSSSRRLSNGRSPLVRKQSQITAFFSSPSPSPTPKPSPSPSPLNPRARKPPLAAPSPSLPKPPSPRQEEKDAAAAVAPAAEAVGRRLRVYWPLDDAWYEGKVEGYDVGSRRHRVMYDDGEEEEVDLASERYEWAAADEEEEVTPQPARKLRRLRRMSDAATANSPGAVGGGGGGGGDETGDSTEEDEDWKKIAAAEDDSEEVELDDEDDDDEVVAAKTRKGKKINSLSMSSSTPKLASGLGSSSISGSTLSKKRRKVDVGVLDCAKKFSFEPANTTGKVELNVPMSCGQREQPLENAQTALTGEVAERFGKRQAEMFKFLGEGRKDAKGRRPGNPNYDPRTLSLPPQFLNSLTGGQMGKFYELFEMDAHVGAKELDLQYMKGDKPHCGFPEKNFEVNLEKLAKKGFRVLVVEQTETPEQLDLRRKETGVKDKVVRREICAMVTKGTLTEGESLLANPDPSYLFSVAESYQCGSEKNQDGHMVGVCIVDVSTSKFIVGQFQDDPERHGLCSILSEIRPAEIIKPAKMLSPETEKALKSNTRDPLINNLLPSMEFWDAEKTIHEIKQYYCSLDTPAAGAQINSAYLPDILSELIEAGDKTYALSALGGSLFYLRQALLDEKLLPCAEFERLACSGLTNPIRKHMILDAAALENLEVLENSRNGGLSGTLYAQLNHCVTGFGKRLLKRWIARPLYDRQAILQRQSAIATFKGSGHECAIQFRKDLSRLPDMERLLARLFSSCDKNGRSSKSVVLYEDASKRLLHQFTAALRGCQQMFQACSSISMLTSTDGSSLLNDLLSPGKGLPHVSSILDHFRDAFDWSEADRNGRIIPHEGCDPQYDAVCIAIEEIESSLKKYLKEQRNLLSDSSVKYVNVGKDIYLLEVSENLRGSVPRNYELQSTKKGFYRYWTPEVKELISELSKAEAEKEAKLKCILQNLIQLFVEHHSKWRQLVSVVAELDVLISIAIASDFFEGPTCCPIIKESYGPDDTPTLHARNLGHPTLRSDSLGSGSFVPNNIKMGGPGNASFIVLTGPNMGGKSTLLRQVCLTIILAQIGANVPAESFELSLVDRMFVRMGARDHIMAGQSTFLVELMETASVLSSATKNSLVALDELGRGTSTSDGQAIAASVLEYLVHRVQCLGLFSTHYHRLAAENKNSKVSLCHMACEISKGEGGLEEVTFLYKLTPGSCPKSYGVNVARLAGIPASVLQRANEKSCDFEDSYGKRPGITKNKPGCAQEDKFATIKDLFRIVKAMHHREDQASCLGMLHEVQKRAKVQVIGE